MSTLKLSFVLTAIDNASSRLKGVRDEVDRLTQPLRRVRAGFNSLAENAGLHDLRRSLHGVLDAVGQLGASLGRVAGGVALAAGGAFWGVKRVADSVDKLNDDAQKLGIAPQRLQELGYAAQMSGSSMEEMTTSLQFLSQNMVEALNGSKEMQTWFARLGITMGELRKMDVGDVFERAADVYHRVGDVGQNAAKKIAMSRAMMGRGGAAQNQLLNQGSAALREFYAEARRVGAVLDNDTIKAMASLNDSVDRARMTLFGAIATALKPVAGLFEGLVNKVVDLVLANRELIATKLSDFVDRVSAALPDIITGLGQFGSAVSDLVGWAQDFAESIGGWGNVLKLVAGLMVGNVLLGVLQLGLAIGGLAKSLGLVTLVTTNLPGILAAGLGVLRAFGLALITAMGPVGAMATLVGLGISLVMAWEPAKKLFWDLWEVLKKVGGFVWGAGKKLLGFEEPPQGGGAPTQPAQRPTVASPVSGSAALRGAPTEVGGTIKIQIDSEGKPQLKGLNSKNPLVDFDVYGGPNLVGG